MAEIMITTDGTILGTKLTVDGKDVTKKEKVVNINLSAHAPYKSEYSDEIYKGGVSVGFATIGEDGKIERKSYGTTDTDYVKGIGAKMKQNDSVIRYVGSAVDEEIVVLVDKLVAHCEEKKIPCPSKEILLNRSKSSLLDKASDLELTLED